MKTYLKQLKTVNPVIVVWEDAIALPHSHACPTDTRAGTDDLIPPCQRYTIGYLVRKDADALIIGQTYDPTGSQGDVPSIDTLTRIPAGMILKVIKCPPSQPKSRPSRRSSTSPSFSASLSQLPLFSQPASPSSPTTSAAPLSQPGTKAQERESKAERDKDTFQLP